MTSFIIDIIKIMVIKFYVATNVSAWYQNNLWGRKAHTQMPVYTYVASCECIYTTHKVILESNDPLKTHKYLQGMSKPGAK